jgi:hypothetical protein
MIRLVRALCLIQILPRGFALSQEERHSVKPIVNAKHCPDGPVGDRRDFAGDTAPSRRLRPMRFEVAGHGRVCAGWVCIFGEGGVIAPGGSMSSRCHGPRRPPVFPIKAIGAACGYDDLIQITKPFKLVHGQSPGVFRWQVSGSLTCSSG